MRPFPRGVFCLTDPGSDFADPLSEQATFAIDSLPAPSSGQSPSIAAPEADIDSLAACFAATSMAGSEQPRKDSKVESFSGRPRQPGGTEHHPPPETSGAPKAVGTLAGKEDCLIRTRKLVGISGGINKRRKPTQRTTTSTGKCERTASIEYLPASVFCYDSTSMVREKGNCDGGSGIGESAGSGSGGVEEQRSHGGQRRTPVNGFVCTGVTDKGTGLSVSPEDATSASPADQGFESHKSKEEQVVNEHLKLLVLLHHVHTCKVRDDNACAVTECAGIKRMWGHARACDGHACKVSFERCHFFVCLPVIVFFVACLLFHYNCIYM